jgi:hypothetical protein
MKPLSVVESLRHENGMKQRKINQLKERATSYRKAVELRKLQLTQYARFCDWLLKEVRATKEEMRLFIKRKKDVRK